VRREQAAPCRGDGFPRGSGSVGGCPGSRGGCRGWVFLRLGQQRASSAAMSRGC